MEPHSFEDIQFILSLLPSPWQALHRPFSMRYGPVWLYCVLFCLYWCASCYWFVILLKDAHEMHEVYRDRLGISTRELVRGGVTLEHGGGSPARVAVDNGTLSASPAPY